VTLLLDTHALLWWLADDPALTPVARDAIRAVGTLVLVSAATAGEISIKQALGKLQAPDDLEAALVASRFQPLPITMAHALAAGRLPRYHDGPFDRMLIAQAQYAQLTIVTHDPKFRLYDVAILWT
jgi:PIN domain nuclease of toxin-antitoxin system